MHDAVQYFASLAKAQRAARDATIAEVGAMQMSNSKGPAAAAAAAAAAGKDRRARETNARAAKNESKVLKTLRENQRLLFFGPQLKTFTACVSLSRWRGFRVRLAPRVGDAQHTLLLFAGSRLMRRSAGCP
jgi:hypothetical protein